MDYTVEIYKVDRRYHKGERLIEKVNLTGVPSKAEVIKVYEKMNGMKNYRYEIHETFVTKKNFMSGEEFKERYDTPYYCSPSSETYWSM